MLPQDYASSDDKPWVFGYETYSFLHATNSSQSGDSPVVHLVSRFPRVVAFLMWTTRPATIRPQQKSVPTFRLTENTVCERGGGVCEAAVCQSCMTPHDHRHEL